MTIPDPPWKQKTRPCPFYSQGRCLFSDSCNFLHDVKVKVKQPEIALTTPTPDVTISFTQCSPVTTASSSKLSVRSPPRSPRLSSLLLALGDVITPDEETLEEHLDEVEGSYFSTGAVVSQEASSQENDVQTANLAYLDEVEPYADSTLAPPEPMTLGAEEIALAAMEGCTATHQATAGEDAPHDSDDLLSPIEVRLAPPFFMPLGQLQGPVHREDSVDSGYADGWTGPSPFSLSPPRNESSRRYSTLSLISSPFGSPARGLSPKFGPSAGSAWPTSPIFSPVKPKSSSRPTSLRLSQTSDDLDSPTDYHRTQLLDSPLQETFTSPTDEDATVRQPISAVLQDDSRQPSLPAPSIPTDTYSHTTPPPAHGSSLQAPVNQDLPPNSPPSPSHIVDQQFGEEEIADSYDFGYTEESRPSSPHSREEQDKTTSSLLRNVRQDEYHQSSPRSSIDRANQSSRTSLPPASDIITPAAVDQAQIYPSIVPTVVPVHTVDEPAEDEETTSLYDDYHAKEIPVVPVHTVDEPAEDGETTSLYDNYHAQEVPHSTHLHSPRILAGLTPSSKELRSTLPLCSPDVHRSDPSHASSTRSSSQTSEFVAGSSKDPVHGFRRESMQSSRATSRASSPRPSSQTPEFVAGSANDPVHGLRRESMQSSRATSRASSPRPSSQTPEFVAGSANDPVHGLRRESMQSSWATSHASSPPAKDPVHGLRRESMQSSRATSHSSSPRPSSQTPEFVAGSAKDPVHGFRRESMQSSRATSRATSPRTSPVSPLSRPVRPYSTLSRQSSISELDARINIPVQRSTKVPFGFRHSIAARSRESLISRPGSAPPVRHRPPALVSFLSNRSNSLNDNPSTEFIAQEPLSSSRLRPLRLSTLLNSSSSSLVSPTANGLMSASIISYTASSHPSSPSVSSDYSISNNPLLSSAHSDFIPSHVHNTNISPIVQSLDAPWHSQSLPHSAPVISHSHSLWNNHSSSYRSPSQSPSQIIRPSYEPSKQLSEDHERTQQYPQDDIEDEARDRLGELDRTVVMRATEIVSVSPLTRPSSTTSFIPEPAHAIATPRPTLLFAIASDNVDEVRRVLESGEASPNDDVGPQSALAFTLTSNSLKHKTEMVKLLLAHGANPASLNNVSGHVLRSPGSQVGPSGSATPQNTVTTLLDQVDPATRYYISRAQAPQTRRASALIHRSIFRPLAKVRYEMIGQDRALEQLFRVLSMPTMAPIVVLLCGPSGHGKSFLASRFGALLDVPIHTVNMTTLRSTHDIWKSYSMSPHEEPTSCTLADFLIENEGKRCVVVLDEIEKTENDKVLSSLLMPWELGRCSFEAGHRHVNVSKVIWLGTSNIGHDLVFEHQASRQAPQEPISREEYVDLMAILRPIVSDRLGPSLLSRVTTVLPFVPFNTEEKLAIAAEALHVLAQDALSDLPAATVEKIVHDSLQGYVPAEGARSLYRAVSTQLLETM